MPYDLVVRYSELATLADCQLKYKLAYAEALVQTSKPRLVLGSAYHALMQGHYEEFRRNDLNGAPRDLDAAHVSARHRLSEYVRSDPEGDGKHVDDEMLATLRWMYAGHVELYGTDSDWDRIAVIEQRRVVPLVSHLGVRVQLAVTADLVVHHRAWDRYLLVDHKTVSNQDATKASRKKENQLDPQRKLYSASFTIKGPKAGRLPIFGAYHSTARVDQLKRDMLPEERFGRTPVYYNERELEQAWLEAQNLARDAVEIRLGRGRAKRMYPSPDPLTCSWKCQFKEPHLTSSATGRDPVQVALDYGFQRAAADNPLIGFMVPR